MVMDVLAAEVQPAPGLIYITDIDKNVTQILSIGAPVQIDQIQPLNRFYLQTKPTVVTLVQETDGRKGLETTETWDDGKDAIEDDLVNEDFGSDTNNLVAEEEDLKGKGTRWEAGFLMHSQHLQKLI